MEETFQPSLKQSLTSRVIFYKERIYDYYYLLLQRRLVTAPYICCKGNLKMFGLHKKTHHTLIVRQITSLLTN